MRVMPRSEGASASIRRYLPEATGAYVKGCATADRSKAAKKGEDSCVRPAVISKLQGVRRRTTALKIYMVGSNGATFSLGIADGVGVGLD